MHHDTTPPPPRPLSPFPLSSPLPPSLLRTLRKKTSAHCMQGYMTCAALISSVSLRPMMVQHRWILHPHPCPLLSPAPALASSSTPPPPRPSLTYLCSELSLAMSMTLDQYSSLCALISSEAHRNSTLRMSMPTAFQISIM